MHSSEESFPAHLQALSKNYALIQEDCLDSFGVWPYLEREAAETAETVPPKGLDQPVLQFYMS